MRPAAAEHGPIRPCILAFGEPGATIGALQSAGRDRIVDPIISAPHDQGLVLLTGAAGGATTSGAREIKHVGDTGEDPLPITG
jgi:hypothetical protein